MQESNFSLNIVKIKTTMDAIVRYKIATYRTIKNINDMKPFIQTNIPEIEKWILIHSETYTGTALKVLQNIKKCIDYHNNNIANLDIETNQNILKFQHDSNMGTIKDLTDILLQLDTQNKEPRSTEVLRDLNIDYTSLDFDFENRILNYNKIYHDHVIYYSLALNVFAEFINNVNSVING
jgi:hypothetical protein